MKAKKEVSLDNKIQSENIAQTCECKTEEIIFLPCSGGSNCGQITNHVAVNLDIEKVGRIYCLAGIATHIDGMVESAKGAKRTVALDGWR
ncbi:MAG: putative zinc-binding protein [Chloroflexi bacterium]|nr:putative zinc-binding protein [Chloroflexota bacterium]